MAGQGRVLVTGAAAGLGEALCRQLLSDGRQVVAIDRDREGLAVLQKSFGNRIVPLECDLADRTAIQAIEQDLIALGPFELVVFNAGISATGQFAQIPVERQSSIIEVNLTAPVALTASLLRADLVEPRGCLVFISSLSRYLGYPGASAYAASKQGLASFARSLRRPLSRKRIMVLTVCPGPMDTAHAAEHAPAGADGRNRMDPGVAASKILAEARHPALTGWFLGGNIFVPGLLPKLAAFVAMLLPAPATRLMRRIIFEKL